MTAVLVWLCCAVLCVCEEELGTLVWWLDHHGARQPQRSRRGCTMSSRTSPFTFMVQAVIIVRLAQSAERKALNLVVVGSSPTVGVVALWLSFLSTGIHDLKQQGRCACGQ